MVHRAGLERMLVSTWYEAARPPFALKLLSYLFRGASAARRAGYAHHLLPSRRVAVPVVVVGNITAGGSGKTPLTIWLARALGERGLRAGIVTRGYAGGAKHWPRQVTGQSSAAEVGDEALLLARATGCPVVVGPDRAAAAARLLDRAELDVIIADDGLQHYALARDFEIAVIDGERGLGNGWPLPAGPLREPAARLDQVDCIVVKGAGGEGIAPGTVTMTLDVDRAWSLAGESEQGLSAFRGAPVHAAAGIGNPGQFFEALRARGIEVIPHPLPDHAALTLEELEFGDGRPVLMTEKDAVKLPPTSDSRLWVVPARASLADVEARDLLTRIAGLVRVK
jgi:tetraacyldisaccharide 4'-kinase